MILNKFRVYYISRDCLQDLSQDDELREYVSEISFKRVVDPFPTSLLFDDSFKNDFYKFDINSSIAYCAINVFKQLKKQPIEQFQKLFNVSEIEYFDLVTKLQNYRPVSRGKDYYLHPLAIKY